MEWSSLLLRPPHSGVQYHRVKGVFHYEMFVPRISRITKDLQVFSHETGTRNHRILLGHSPHHDLYSWNTGSLALTAVIVVGPKMHILFWCYCSPRVQIFVLHPMPTCDESTQTPRPNDASKGHGSA